MNVKVGIVGCGGIALAQHIPSLISMDNVEVVAVCDILPERAEKVGEKSSAKHIFTDYNDLIAFKEVDMIDICTPNYLHAPIAIKAMEAGKHVFCEKPDAISLEEAIQMKEVSERTGKHLMVVRNNRFGTHSQFIKKYITEGKCGDIYAGRCGWIRRRGIPGKGGWFTTAKLSGGGPLIDLGVHMIDLAMWFMGNPVPVTVSGSTYNKFAGESSTESDSENAKFGDAVESGTFDVEDLAIGMIRFDNGACLHLEFSWASNIESECNFIELRGSKAGIKWHNGKSIIYTEESGALVDISPSLPAGISSHHKNLEHFISDVIIDGKQPIFEPIQGVNMVKILTALYESARLQREIVL